MYAICLDEVTLVEVEKGRHHILRLGQILVSCVLLSPLLSGLNLFALESWSD